MIATIPAFLVSASEHWFILGALGGVISLVLKFEEFLKPKTKKWMWRFDVAFIVLSFALGMVKNKADDTTQEQIAKQLEYSKSLADEAISKWKASDDKVSSLSNLLAEERRRLLIVEDQAQSLEKQTSGKELTREEILKLSKFLFNAPKGEVTIVIINADVEAGKFSNQLAEVLRENGFTVKTTGATVFTSDGMPFTGVHAHIKSNSAIPLFSHAILNGLKDVGIKVSAELKPGMEYDDFELEIGPGFR